MATPYCCYHQYGTGNHRAGTWYVGPWWGSAPTVSHTFLRPVCPFQPLLHSTRCPIPQYLPFKPWPMQCQPVLYCSAPCPIVEPCPQTIQAPNPLHSWAHHLSQEVPVQVQCTVHSWAQPTILLKRSQCRCSREHLFAIDCAISMHKY